MTISAELRVSPFMSKESAYAMLTIRGRTVKTQFAIDQKCSNRPSFVCSRMLAEGRIVLAEEDNLMTAQGWIWSITKRRLPAPGLTALTVP